MLVRPMKVICIGAHPDDCEIGFGGVAHKLVSLGHRIKFVSVTNGAAGHYAYSPSKMTQVRRLEAEESARQLGITATEVLTNQDAALQPTLQVRWEIVRQIRGWEADMVVTHRPWDYHPDHRYTSQVVQDSSYLVQVPAVCPETPPLRSNPIFLYLEDSFHQPLPFTADVAVDIDDVWDIKIRALEAHFSQFYDWLPWIDGEEGDVPQDPAARRCWLSSKWTRPIAPSTQARLSMRYGADRAARVRHAEAFQLCEYGRRATQAELDGMFPR